MNVNDPNTPKRNELSDISLPAKGGITKATTTPKNNACPVLKHILANASIWLSFNLPYLNLI